MWDWDFATNEVRWDEGMRKLFGYSAKQVKHDFTWWSERIHSDDRERVVSGVESVIETGGQSWAGEYRYRRADGSYAYVFDRGYVIRNRTGKPVRMIGAMVDLTAHKRAEEALKESRRWLQAIMDHFLGLVSAKDPKGTVILVNRNFSVLEGPSPEEFVGKNVYELFPKDIADVLWQNDLAAQKAAGPVESEETVFHKDGSRHTYLTIKFPVREADQLVATCAISVDITDRKRAEEELRASREQLHALAGYLQAAREEERRRIARELHDEIGQILTGIKIALERSAREPPHLFKGGVDQALGLTDELIERVRDLSLELRPAVLDDLGLLSARYFDRYTTQFKIEANFQHSGLKGRRFEPEIETAAYRIVQEALTNVARHARVDHVEVRISADEDTLSIRITDTGVGFDPDSLSVRATGGLSGMRETNRLVGIQQILCFFKHGVEHLPRQLAGKRVLLARMIGAQKRKVVAQPNERAVTEVRPWFGNNTGVFSVGFEKRVKRDLSQSHHDTSMLEQLQLLNEIGPASVELRR
jgi:PAS domain S-box-containing protein